MLKWCYVLPVVFRITVDGAEFCFVEFVSCAGEVDTALVQGNDSLAVLFGQVDLMEGDDDRDPLLGEFAEGGHDTMRGLGVEGGDRLVGKHHRGSLSDGASDSAALLLASGKGACPLARLRGQADLVQGLHGLDPVLAVEAVQKSTPGGCARGGSDQDVVMERKARDEVEGLEDEADTCPCFANGRTQLSMLLDRRPKQLNGRFRLRIACFQAIAELKQGRLP